MKTLDKFTGEISNKEKLSLLKSEFYQYFTKNGYKFIEPLPINSNEDQTVQFIGSSTNVFKKTLLNGCEELCFTVQKCLRARNTGELLDDSSKFKWGSLFTMFGTIGNPISYDQQCNDIYSFFTEVLDIPVNRLCLQVHNDDEHLLDPWKDKEGLKLEIGKQPEAYYRWKYGEKGLSGRGVTLALLSEKDDYPQELGNIIQISDENKIIGVEMGFGLECLFTRIEGKEHTIEATELAPFFDLDSNAEKKYADAIMVCMTLVSLGVSVGARGQGRILREYIKGVVYFLIKENISRGSLTDLLLKIEIDLVGKNIGIAANLYDNILSMYEDITLVSTDVRKKTNDEIISLINKR